MPIPDTTTVSGPVPKTYTASPTELRKRHFDTHAEWVKSVVPKKNADYDESYYKLYKEYGYVALLLPIVNKVHRVSSLLKRGGATYRAETVVDSLLDLAGYALNAAAIISAESTEDNYGISK